MVPRKKNHFGPKRVLTSCKNEEKGKGPKYLVREDKNGGGKGGKYLLKEN